MASKKYPHVVTQEERDRFEGFIRKWQKALNLTDWRIEFLKEPGPRSAHAVVEILYEHRLAKVQFTANARRPYTDVELEEYALHELLHVRLADLIHVVKGESEEKVIEAAEHSVIVLFDKLLRK